MIEIEKVGAQTLYKRVGDSVTVSVKLRNDGNATGTVTLNVEVYEPINEVWVRITDRIQGDDVSVSPNSTVTKSYSFKPFTLAEWIGVGTILDIRASISGDSTDEYEDFFEFGFSDGPDVTWYDGSHELKILEEFPSGCSGSATEKHNFRFGEEVKMMYRAFNFKNSSPAKVLFTILQEITSDTCWLWWQGVSTLRTPSTYWACYLLKWWGFYPPEGTYLVYATPELSPGYTRAIDFLHTYFNVY